MDGGSIIYEVIFCAEEDEYRVYCEICDKLCIERYLKNHLKSGTHPNNSKKRQDSIFLFLFSQSQNNVWNTI